MTASRIRNAVLIESRELRPWAERGKGMSLLSLRGYAELGKRAIRSFLKL
jgi:hypothetical protein